MTKRLGCARLLKANGDPAFTDTVWVVQKLVSCGSGEIGCFDGSGDSQQRDDIDLVESSFSGVNFVYYLEMFPLPPYCPAG